MKINILDIVKKLVKWDNKLEIYTQGYDNLYPERQERLISNSITAKMGADLMFQYIIGEGLGVSDSYKVNKTQNLIDFATDLTMSIVKQRGAFIHFDYNMNFEPVNPVIMPFDRCRIGKKDSKEYNGKILYKIDWTDQKESVVSYNVFSDNPKVIEKQIENAGGIEKYKGQILFINLDRHLTYPLSRVDAVANDCDSETQASVYRNQLLRKGFFGKQIVVTPPLIQNDLEPTYIDEHGNTVPNREWRQKEDEATQVKETIEQFIGAENAGGAMLMQLPDFEGSIDDVFKVIRIDSSMDDKMFEYTEGRVSTNILMAFNNLPEGLVKSPNNSLLGNSGESLRVLQDMYWKNCSKDRKIVERILTDILKKREDWNNGVIEFTPITGDNADASELDSKKLEAQASLKGSVGGVQGILAIQSSVSQGLTDYESAITILNEIFGLDDALARSILGTPEEGVITESNI